MHIEYVKLPSNGLFIHSHAHLGRNCKLSITRFHRFSWSENILNFIMAFNAFYVRC